MRILVVTTMLPGAKLTGSEVASQSFLDGLRAVGHEVVLVGYRRVGTDPPRAEQDVIAADWHIETRGAGLRPALWMGRAVAGRQPYTTAKFVSRAARRAVRAQWEALGPELVVLDHARMSWLGPARWDVPFVYLAHNIEHRLYADLAATATSPVTRWANAREARHIERRERALCRDAAQVWALTADDAQALAGLGAGDRARWFGLPPTAIPAADAAPPTRDVAVLGSWTWKANAAGLRWFLDEVCPRLPAGIGVHVGGAGAEELTAGRANVTYHGRVPDAMAFLRAAQVVAVPSVRGAGVQVKTLDALTTGRAVVATEIAMRGMADPPARTVVTSDPAAFARGVAGALEGEVGPADAGIAWARGRREAFRAALRAATGVADPVPA